MAHSRFKRVWAGFSGVNLGVALSAFGLALAGCETVQLGTGTTDPADTTSSAMSSLTLINQRQKDPGPLVFLLYGPSVQDIENVTPATTFEPVGFEKSLTVQVKPGRWKVAYRLASGDLLPMPPDDDEDIDVLWPVVQFTAGKSYQILIETNDGGHTVWKYDVSIVK